MGKEVEYLLHEAQIVACMVEHEHEVLTCAGSHAAAQELNLRGQRLPQRALVDQAQDVGHIEALVALVNTDEARNLLLAKSSIICSASASAV